MLLLAEFALIKTPFRPDNSYSSSNSCHVVALPFELRIYEPLNSVELVIKLETSISFSQLAELAVTVSYALVQLADVGNVNAVLFNLVFNSGVQSLDEIVLLVMLIFGPAEYSLTSSHLAELAVTVL